MKVSPQLDGVKVVRAALGLPLEGPIPDYYEEEVKKNKSRLLTTFRKIRLTHWPAALKR